jgi:hypothetical protein
VCLRESCEEREKGVCLFRPPLVAHGDRAEAVERAGGELTPDPEPTRGRVRGSVRLPGCCGLSTVHRQGTTGKSTLHFD